MGRSPRDLKRGVFEAGARPESRRPLQSKALAGPLLPPLPPQAVSEQPLQLHREHLATVARLGKIPEQLTDELA
jgi:hypothetical protein